MLRRRRLRADVWLSENQAKLIEYALQGNDQNEIFKNLEQSKLQSEISTG